LGFAGQLEPSTFAEYVVVVEYVVLEWDNRLLPIKSFSRRNGRGSGASLSGLADYFAHFSFGVALGGPSVMLQPGRKAAQLCSWA